MFFWTEVRMMNMCSCASSNHSWTLSPSYSFSFLVRFDEQQLRFVEKTQVALLGTRMKNWNLYSLPQAPILIVKGSFHVTCLIYHCSFIMSWTGCRQPPSFPSTEESQNISIKALRIHLQVPRQSQARRALRSYYFQLMMSVCSQRANFLKQFFICASRHPQDI